MVQKTICFRNADWIVGWDTDNQRHCYFKNADLAFRGDKILFAGPGRFDGDCDEEIAAVGRCLMPGLVDIHNHSASMPTFRGIREDLGNPSFYFSGLYEGWGLFMPPLEVRNVTTRAAICEMLLSGVTTYVDMSYPYPGWLDAVAESRIRASVSPLFDSAKTIASTDHTVEYKWAPDGGFGDFKRAVELLEEVERHPSDRLSAMMSPMAVDTCTPQLLRAAHGLALERNWPYHLHAGMAVIEFHEMVRRGGKTSIQWLKEQGVLGPSTIIGHGAILDHHSWVHWHTKDDISILADSGASISHCPVVLSRCGITLESFGRYKRAGINIGIGTDCHPHNMLEEMREAAVLCRVSEQHMFSATTADVFDAATIGGARALMRDDIGRLTPGAKADIVVVDVTHPIMLPLYDPIRSLIFSACDRAVKDVYIGGEQVVSDGTVLTIDHQRVAKAVSDIQDAVVLDIPNRDRKHRSAEQVAPKTYETLSAPG